MLHHALPVELYVPIAEYAEKKDLVSLMLVSRLLHSEVERVLYREIKLGVDSERYHVSRAAFYNLSSSPRTAQYVVRLGIKFSAFVGSADAPKMVSAALQQMVNLRHFTLVVSGRAASLQDLTRGCTFQLRYIEYHNHDDDSAYLPTFFALQPQIEHVRIPYYPRASILSSALPRLRIIDGPQYLAEALLENRSRPITRLIWQSSGSELKIHAPFPHLKVLKVREADDLSTLDLGAPSTAPNLRFLKVRYWDSEVIEPPLITKREV